MRLSKRLVLASVAAAAIAVGGGVGVASAQAAPSPSTPAAPVGQQITPVSAAQGNEALEAGPDTDNVQEDDQSAPDTAEKANGPDTDNVQEGDQTTPDGAPNAPGK
jgi:hypothetical protein